MPKVRSRSIIHGSITTEHTRKSRKIVQDSRGPAITRLPARTTSGQRYTNTSTCEHWEVPPIQTTHSQGLLLKRRFHWIEPCPSPEDQTTWPNYGDAMTMTDSILQRTRSPILGSNTLWLVGVSEIPARSRNPKKDKQFFLKKYSCFSKAIWAKVGNFRGPPAKNLFSLLF